MLPKVHDFMENETLLTWESKQNLLSYFSRAPISMIPNRNKMDFIVRSVLFAMTVSTGCRNFSHMRVPTKNITFAQEVVHVLFLQTGHAAHVLCLTRYFNK